MAKVVNDLQLALTLFWTVFIFILVYLKRKVLYCVKEKFDLQIIIYSSENYSLCACNKGLRDAE